jgi:hypothetical protein
MRKRIEITVEGVHLADAAPTASLDAIRLYHKVDGLIRLHSTLTLTTAQHNHLAAGFPIVVKDLHGNAFAID